MRFLPILLLFFVAVASFSFAEITCSPSFTENVTVRVLDNNLRAIPNAAVRVYFQLDKTTSKGYKYTPFYYTNESGQTQEIKLHNLEVDPLKVDCEFIVYVNYDGKEVKKTLTVSGHGSVIDVQMDAYLIIMRVLDQSNQPVQGAEVSINSVNGTTDKEGYVRLEVSSGMASFFVKYGDGKLSDSMLINNETTTVFGLQLYNLIINVIDDNGKSLQATATVGTSTLSTNENGSMKLERLATATPIVIVKYKNLEKSLDVDLSMQTKYSAIFDSTPPTIGEIKTIATSKTTKIVIPAYDSGPYASGIDTLGVTVRYMASVSDTWHQVPVYLSGKDQYVAEVPLQPPDTIIRFSVDVKDRDNNHNLLEGQFLSATAQNTTEIQNNTQVNPVKPEPKEEGIPLLYVVAGFLIIAVVIYALYKYKFSSENGGGSA